MGARISVIAVALGSLLGSCKLPPPPGELVGHFRIAGTMGADSCGPGLGANHSITFEVEMRDDEGTGYWLYGDRKPSPGTLDGEGNFVFQRRGGWTLIEPRPDLGYGGCRVAQLETIDGHVTRDASGADAGDSDALTGSNTIDVVPVQGDDCSKALAAQGGPFLALPCRVQYALSGTRIDVEETPSNLDADSGSR
jgi:hypothetical protein